MIKWLYSFAKIETASVMSERKRLTTNCVGKKMNRPSNKDNPDYLSAGWKKKNETSPKKKEKVKKEIANNKTASSPEKNLHPHWDCFRDTMFYLLSCGELAINGKKI